MSSKPGNDDGNQDAQEASSTSDEMPTVVPSNNLVANLDRAALARLVEKDPGAVMGLLDKVDSRRHEITKMRAEHEHAEEMKQADLSRHAISVSYRIVVGGLLIVAIVVCGVFGLAFYLENQAIIIDLLKVLGGAGIGTAITVVIQQLVKQAEAD